MVSTEQNIFLKRECNAAQMVTCDQEFNGWLWLRNHPEGSIFLTHRTEDDHDYSLAYHNTSCQFVMIGAYNETWISDSMAKLHNSRKIFTAYPVDAQGIREHHLLVDIKSSIPSSLNEFDLILERGCTFGDLLDHFPNIYNVRELINPDDTTSRNLLQSFQKLYKHTYNQMQTNGTTTQILQNQVKTLQERSQELIAKQEKNHDTQKWILSQMRRKFHTEIKKAINRKRKSFSISFDRTSMSFIRQEIVFVDGMKYANTKCSLGWDSIHANFNTNSKEGKCWPWVFDKIVNYNKQWCGVNKINQKWKYYDCAIKYDFIGGKLKFSCKLMHQNPESQIWQT